MNFFTSITLFAKAMEKSSQLVTKLAACVTLAHYLHNLNLIVLVPVKEAPETSLRISTVFNF